MGYRVSGSGYLGLRDYGRGFFATGLTISLAGHGLALPAKARPCKLGPRFGVNGLRFKVQGVGLSQCEILK